MKLSVDAIGTLNPDGSVAAWPRVRIDGRPYSHSEGLTTRKIGEGRFVVLPQGFTEPVEPDDEATSLEAAFRLMFPEPLEADDDE
jgi:hypothetical protein